MQAYLFADHGADLSAALELVGRGEPGARVRAVAQMTVGSIGSVIAIEAPHLEALDQQVSQLTSGRYTPSGGFVACLAPDCTMGELERLFNVVPSYLPVHEVMLFALLELTGPPSDWPELQSDAAGAVEAGGRRLLLELAADGPEAVEVIQRDLAAIGRVHQVRRIDSSFLTGSRLRTEERGRDLRAD